MKKNIIVAVDNKHGFTKDKKIPWHYQNDFKHFKKITMGNICIMGRNTYTEINDKLNNPIELLSGRTSIVVSSTLEDINNALVISDLSELDNLLFDLNSPNKEIFFIGGKQIYEYALDVCDKIYLTKINEDFNCDEFFNMDKLLNNFTLTNSQELEELTFNEYTNTRSN